MTHTVLIVDDSKLARMAVAKALNVLRPEWTRVEAASADEARQRVGEQPPQIAILDFNMPGTDGLSFAAELLKLVPGIRLAILSANQQIAIVTRARNLGAVFLAKPLSEDALKTFLSAST